MIYSIVRPLARIAIFVFFRKIYLSNVENIPKNKPVILAANHPTAFSEPCVLACFLDRPLYFLVRGNLFTKSIYSFLLHSLNMLPVYRKKDRGYTYVKENYSTFETCFDALYRNKTIMILAEGNTIHEKRLRPLQKGTGRIALGALEKYPDLEEVYIVPTGVNFTYADQVRSEVMIDFGPPILARDYYAQFQENNSQGIADFTENLKDKMSERIIIVDDPADDPLAEQLFVLDRTLRQKPIFPIFNRTASPLFHEKTIATAVNEMPSDDKRALKQKTDTYFQKLEQLDLPKDSTLEKQTNFFGSFLILLFALPLFFAGYILNFLPIRLAKFIADTRVKYIEFYAPVLLAVGLGAYLIYFILALVISLVVGNLWIISLVIAMPFLGYIALLYREHYFTFAADYQLNWVNPEDLSWLKNQKEGILRELNRWI
ncbi:MAG: hypothetical protein DHS20C18_22190 [Saprospiraceae bacterium]|nr:MAG: hypothetical protein DHS20C18_22190 [Saprospiraceae bacterium]